jgi:hypothetical protein
MMLTLGITARHWECHIALVTQLEYWPVRVRWRNEVERGLIFRFLCFVLRFGVDQRLAPS